ncbi:hypothetical protein [Helicobacter pylori]|nr:hypothetical protein [Helicobacter pylori]
MKKSQFVAEFIQKRPKSLHKNKQQSLKMRSFLGVLVMGARTILKTPLSP